MANLTEQQKQIIEQQKNKFVDVMTNIYMQTIFKTSTAYLLSKTEKK